MVLDEAGLWQFVGELILVSNCCEDGIVQVVSRTTNTQVARLSRSRNPESWYGKVWPLSLVSQLVVVAVCLTGSTFR